MEIILNDSQILTFYVSRDLSSTFYRNQHINKVSLKISKSICILYRPRDICPRAVLENLYNALITPHFNYCILCCQREPFSTHSSEEGIEANSNYISHTEPLCKELRVLKVFDMFYAAIWKFYYKLMHNNVPAHISTMKPTLPTVCSRYEIRAPVFHLPYIRHTFAEHSVRFCFIKSIK